MAREEEVYRDLQKQLNKQPVGYPATKSGVEIRLLKRFFSPEEARLAMKLSYKPCSMEDIYEVVKESGMSFSDMENMLDGMLKIKVSSVPQKQKANRCLLEFLAKQLGVKKNAVSITAGLTNPVKQVQVLGISAEILLKKLNLGKGLS